MGTSIRALVAVATAIVALLVALPTPAAATVDTAVKRYQVCWWRMDDPEGSFECRETFRGATAVIDLPTGNCWSDNLSSGMTQVRRATGWTDLPNVPVRFQFSPYCTDPEVPYESFVHLTTRTADFALTRLRFLILFNGEVDRSPVTVVCVRWTRSAKFCQA